MTEVPQSFADMPRWWAEGTAWLAELPGLIQEQCAAWDLRVDGEPVHGSNALVVPVVRDGSELALRMSPPGREVVEQARALRFWDGRGMVRLLAADPGAGAMLLERLEMGATLCGEPVGEAMAVLGLMMRRLAVPAPPDVPSTASLVRDLSRDWHRLGGPFDRALLREAMRVAPDLAHTDSGWAVNGDLHCGQVLRGGREPWLAVDPVLLRGDIEYDLARVLWTRLDDMAGATEIVEHFDLVVREAGLSRDRARDWVVWRAVDYWLWGLSAGLTEDPPRCRRLLAAFAR